MKAYRIAKAKYINDLSGTGAKLYGGRWNPKGYPLLYTSEHKSLAALEVLVHVDRQTIPADLQIISLEIPTKEIHSFDEALFNKIKTSKNANYQMQEAGQKWITSKISLALKVPSILIEGEYNILVNPELHKKMKLVKVIAIDNFMFDERLFI